MLMSKVTLTVFVLAYLFNGLQVQALTCLCTGSTCANNETTCTDATEICYAAVIRLKDGNTRTEKGCKDRAECTTTDFCPIRKEGSVCAKFGCCTYDRCVVNYTLGVDFETPTPSPTPSPTPTPTPSPTPTPTPSPTPTPTPSPTPKPTPSSTPSPTPTISETGQKLTCLCTGSTCNLGVKTCTLVNEVCYAAVIRLKDNSTRIEKGCKARDECKNTDFCPVRAEGSICAKFGCCTYDRCVVNYTLGVDFETPNPTSTSGRVFGLGAFVLIPIGLLCGMF
ncbi:Hypothetical predicted protein [Paramuricea clavata]|nr:Hypothetical predicted protein [Paramuricea clavata]